MGVNDDHNLLAFLERAGKGCISGEVSEWPQLEPACEFAYVEIVRLRLELQYIANAKPSEWDEEMRDQFQEWAQNRARAAIANS